MYRGFLFDKPKYYRYNVETINSRFTSHVLRSYIIFLINLPSIINP